MKLHPKMSQEPLPSRSSGVVEPDGWTVDFAATQNDQCWRALSASPGGVSSFSTLSGGLAPLLSIQAELFTISSLFASSILDHPLFYWSLDP